MTDDDVFSRSKRPKFKKMYTFFFFDMCVLLLLLFVVCGEREIEREGEMKER
mgnify:CR=1 FL=1